MLGCRASMSNNTCESRLTTYSNYTWNLRNAVYSYIQQLCPSLSTTLIVLCHENVILFNFNVENESIGATLYQTHMLFHRMHVIARTAIYGCNLANGCWQENDHIDGQHNTTWILFPASTHREAEWSISHSTTGKAFLALKCTTVDLPSQSCWCYRVDCGLTPSSTTTSCMH